jgi:hypothetical protein
MSTLISYPLDAFRVRILFGVPKTKNLMNGIIFTFLFSVFKQGLVWPIQKDFQEYVKLSGQFENEFLGIIVSGTIGNLIPSILFNPFNIIKVRYMETHEKQSFFQITKNIYIQEGIKAFSKGLIPTLLRDGIWGMIYFPVFSYLQEVNSKINQEKTFFSLISATTTAASLATIFSSLFDGVRLHQQRSIDPQIGYHHSFWSGLKIAITPNKNNFMATLTGIIRVVISTVMGHLTYLKISKQINNSSHSNK